MRDLIISYLIILICKYEIDIKSEERLQSIYKFIDKQWAGWNILTNLGEDIYFNKFMTDDKRIELKELLYSLTDRQLLYIYGQTSRNDVNNFLEKYVKGKE